MTHMHISADFCCGQLNPCLGSRSHCKTWNLRGLVTAVADMWWVVRGTWIAVRDNLTEDVSCLSNHNAKFMYMMSLWLELYYYCLSRQQWKYQILELPHPCVCLSFSLCSHSVMAELVVSVWRYDIIRTKGQSHGVTMWYRATSRHDTTYWCQWVERTMKYMMQEVHGRRGIFSRTIFELK